jgi:hypothetical protein
MDIEIKGKKILLIGNGFDLAHGLPTSYSFFLDFCDKIKETLLFPEFSNDDEWKKDIILNWDIDNSIKSKLFEEWNTNNNLNKLFIEIYDNIKSNIWITYFLKKRNQLGKNWIDFESEISNVVQAFECVRNCTESGKSIPRSEIEGIKVEEVEEFIDIFEGNDSKKFQLSYFNLNIFNKCIKQMTLDLDSLIRALEIYISGFINKIEGLQKNDDIKDINPDCVLSFNYSNTYERIYGQSNKIKYDYIHGKADINNNVETCNLVLGIDEYLEGHDRDEKLEFLAFKKFYQRIYKSTDSSYMEWIDEIHRNFLITYKLYIFGHSLDKTDKDILALLICNDNVQTKIYYHRKSNDDKKELGKLIRNLVRVIGAKELIRRTGGSHKTIEFIPQTLPEVD